ncbi:unnamed protein product [Bathycoccus prasinos]|jgi:hypothetical protein|tara:strand:+ start:1219 stop:2556 length:1338 start_codon:yes stop_codon:yes gene_type:complete
MEMSSNNNKNNPTTRIKSLVAVSGYTGKVLRIGCSTLTTTKKQKEEEEEEEEEGKKNKVAFVDDEDILEEEKEEDIFLNAAEADRKTTLNLNSDPSRGGGGGEGGDKTTTKANDDSQRKNEDNDEDEDEDEASEEEQEESEDETNEVDVGRDWATMQIVLDRQPQADAMLQLWKRDKGKWLIESKKRWKKRHDELTARRKKEDPNYTSGIVAGDRARRADELSFVNRGSRAMNAMQRGQINADAHMAAFGRPVKVAVNLATLTKLGFLLKGKKKMFVVYLGNVYTGDLTEEGEIICGCKVGSCDRRVYTSPSAWAIHCKRNVNPSKKADDGWKSARYGNPEGYALEHFKGVYDAWRRGIELTDGGAGAVTKKKEEEDDDDDADMVNDAAKEPDSLEKRQRDAATAEKAFVYPLPEGTHYEPDDEDSEEEEEEEKDDGDDNMDVDD